ncbi:MAG: DNA-3-methyladenine glycosylase 2 family protein [Candidatus Eisenbacteria bacterium]|uniref:DNA-3-methyladenine glycosylase II n=1 Tax=Eiseniibacteriota bacterium TaxID=2212470 RepID=A0A849ST22_UNCEI|nr:DNA-3-methyladenine glycosylase 2 family protein [Candidatus Eisenbacteria bacterium]
MPPQDICYRALEARDRRFEGRFVTAVLTTHIYCRPGCPARIPARRNVRFYACPAAAEGAGFRPCLRCRPDATAGSPAGAGTSATVTRALRLIEDGVLDRDGVEGLADRLGVTDRWLRRLFDEQLGASPLAVARTRRVHFARRLIDDGVMPLEDIAQASGFGSARRLRAAIRATFHRSPAELRGRRAPADFADLGGQVLRLPARAPFDPHPIFAFFGGRAIPGVEAVADGVYRRTAEIDGDVGVLEVRAAPGDDALLVRWSGSSPRGLLSIATRVGRMFDLAADVRLIGTTLARDPKLAVRWPRSGVRVPSGWDAFEVAVRALLGQQVSVAAARTLAGRLVARCATPLAASDAAALTHVFPTPHAVGQANLDKLGLPQSRIDALQGMARAVADGSLVLAAPEGVDAFVEHFSRLPGIGRWTAEYVAMRALAEPDAFPAGDLGVRKALAMNGRLPSERETRAIAEAWRPWRAYAALALWRDLSKPKPSNSKPRRRS